MGTVKDLADNSGSVVNHVKYDAFGGVVSQSNPAFESRYGFTGREFDAETGLYYYRARYYDAAIGRFIGEDSVGFNGGDANLYRYVGNSPVKNTDPSGLVTFVIPGAYNEIGDLESNLKKYGNYPVVLLKNPSGSKPGPDISGLKASNIIQIVGNFLSRGILGNEPVNIVAHSDGNNLIPGLVAFIRGLGGIPQVASRQGFGRPTACIDTTQQEKGGLKINVARLDPTGAFKAFVYLAGANKVVDVWSNNITTQGSGARSKITDVAGALYKAGPDDIKARSGVSHNGLLYNSYNEDLIKQLKNEKGFRF